MARNRASAGQATKPESLDFEDSDRPHVRECDWDGCRDQGDYRAPKSPQEIHNFRWFCLDHVREYNKGWNYFGELSTDEIEAIIQRDTVWHRPSWPLGARPGHDLRLERLRRRDPFNLFDEPARPAPEPPRGPRDEALTELGLDRTATMTEIKTRYKTLVKRYHPDANGGSKESEERIKSINMAYSYLRGCESE